MNLTANWTAKDGLLQDERLSARGLRHGFTLRRLGNMKDESRRRQAAEILGLQPPHTLRQLHGTVIHGASKARPGLEGDGWVADAPAVCVGVYMADCVPLILMTEDGKKAGVFHAGWRGTAQKMAQAAVRAMGTPKLLAAIGPHIGPCCYRVGPELDAHFPPSSFPRPSHLDLGAETRRQLLQAGVPEANIGACGPCTSCHPDDYYSFRRDKQDARMLALLSL